jgi:hypothetical protein
MLQRQQHHGPSRIAAEMSARFNSEFCAKLNRVVAVICLALVLCAVVLMATVQSSKCPGWVITTTRGEPVYIWVFVAMAGFWALVVSYYAITWRRFAQRIIDMIEWGEATFVRGTRPTWYGDWTQFNAMCAAQLEFNSLFVVVMVGSIGRGDAATDHCTHCS